MPKIYKYVIPYLEQTKITFQLQKGAWIRHIQALETPNHVICMWVEVDINPDIQELEDRTFELFGTGVDIPENTRYVGTTIGVNDIVMHVFEITAFPKGYLAEKTIPIVTDL